MFARALQVVFNGVALATAAAIALPHQVAAQARRGLEVAPAVGAYLPTGNLPGGSAFHICIPDPSNPDKCLPFVVRAKQAVAVGGRVTAWLSNRGAIEGSFWYSPSRVVSGFLPVDSSEQAGNFVAAALRFVLSLAPRAPAMSALVMGGPAMVHRSFENSPEGTTSFGGALGFALDMRPKRHLGVRAQIEDYLYNPHAAMRHEFVLSLSISLVGQRADRQ